MEESEFEILHLFCFWNTQQNAIFVTVISEITFLDSVGFWLGGTVLIFGRKMVFQQQAWTVVILLFMFNILWIHTRSCWVFSSISWLYWNSLLIIWYHTMCWRTCSSKDLFSYFYCFYCSTGSGSVCLHFSQEGSKPLFSVLLSSWFSTVLQKHYCGQCLWRHIKRKGCVILNVWGRTQLSSTEWKEFPATRWVYF